MCVSQLVLPESLKLLPLLTAAILKMDAFGINGKPNLARCASCVCCVSCIFSCSHMFMCFACPATQDQRVRLCGHPCGCACGEFQQSPHAALAHHPANRVLPLVQHPRHGARGQCCLLFATVKLSYCCFSVPRSTAGQRMCMKVAAAGLPRLNWAARHAPCHAPKLVRPSVVLFEVSDS